MSSLCIFGAILTLDHAIRCALEDPNRFPAVLTLAQLGEQDGERRIAEELRALAAAFGCC